MKNKITDLRNHLFEQLEKLKDPDCDLETEIKRSKAMVEVGSVIVESAKVEVDFIRHTSSEGSGFIPGQKQLSN